MTAEDGLHLVLRELSENAELTAVAVNGKLENIRAIIGDLVGSNEGSAEAAAREETARSKLCAFLKDLERLRGRFKRVQVGHLSQTCQTIFGDLLNERARLPNQIAALGSEVASLSEKVAKFEQQLHVYEMQLACRCVKWWHKSAPPSTSISTLQIAPPASFASHIFAV